MHAFRGGLRWVACGWLATQLAAFAAAPAAMCSHHSGQSTTKRQTKCCPGVAAGKICPMHHAREGSQTKCTMRAACHDGEAALLSLLSIVGVESSGSGTYELPVSPDRVLPLAAAPVTRTELPESPPPRV